jgi:hypothetical protein
MHPSETHGMYSIPFFKLLNFAFCKSKSGWRFRPPSNEVYRCLTILMMNMQLYQVENVGGEYEFDVL